MDNLKAKREGLKRRQRRVRGKVSGTAQRPRIRVTRTNSNIYAQMIDDVKGVTLCSASTLDPEFKEKKNAGNIKGAKEVGELLGNRAVAAGITEAVFDRGGHIYHGRVQALAEGARSAGLKF